MFIVLIRLFFYCILITNLVNASEFSNSLQNNFERKIEYGVSETVNYFAGKLEKFNDKHLGESILGPQYKYLKTKLQAGESARPGRKMHAAMLPLVFQVGATSTWLLLTALMAAKSVAIGLILLVFKIAVSSAKVSAFFTAWKQKHHHDHHSYHEHGHYRSLNLDQSSYFPEWHNKEDQEWKEALPYQTLASPNTVDDAEPLFKNFPTSDEQFKYKESSINNIPTSYDTFKDKETSFKNFPTSDEQFQYKDSSTNNIPISYDSFKDKETSFKNLATGYEKFKNTQQSFENLPTSYEVPKNSYDSLATSYNPSGDIGGQFKDLTTGFDDPTVDSEPYGGYEYADEDDLKNDFPNAARKSKRTAGSTKNYTDKKTQPKAIETATTIVLPCKNCEWLAPLALQN